MRQPHTSIHLGSTPYQTPINRMNPRDELIKIQHEIVQDSLGFEKT